MTIREVYEKADIRSLPVSPEETARRVGIKLVSYRTMTEVYDISTVGLYTKSRLGFSFCENGRFVIAINECSCGERRRRFTVAHEIGHCVLGHLSRESSAENEREADRFAAELLAPICVLRECGITRAEEISRLCGISMAAAEIALKRLLSGEKTPDGKEIVARFCGFISDYRKSAQCLKARFV